LGPRGAIRELQVRPLARGAACGVFTALQASCDRVALCRWVNSARCESILGSCPKTLPSVAAGIRCWEDFVCSVLRPAGVAQHVWPPTLDGLLSWGKTFRHHKTFSNYLGYARVGCLVAGKDDAVFDERVLKRAKVALALCTVWRRCACVGCSGCSHEA